MKRLVFILGLVALLSSSSCESFKKHPEPNLEFEVTNPLRQDAELTRDHVCQVRSIQHIEVRALEKGYLTNIYVDEGQLVKKGELLFQVMPRINEAELNEARAEADFAKIEYENTKQLHSKNIVAKSELELARATLDKANANLALAQVHLDLTQVKAPFDGIVGRLMVRSGSLMEEGDLLTTLSDNHEMWVYFNVPEAEYLDYIKLPKEKRPSHVKLRMANNKLYQHIGEITAIEADFNNETGNIAFRATFPNPEGYLRHGQTGNVLLDISIKDALLIPQKATFEILDKRFVYAVDQNGLVSTKPITISTEMQDLFVVSEGLSEKDRILLEGLRRVRDGDTITAKFESPQLVLSQLEAYAE